MDITDLRKQIDEVDEALIRLFSERMDIVANIARYKFEHKLPVFVPAREQEVLRSVSERSRPGLERYTQALYSMLFELSRAYQNDQLPPVSSHVIGKHSTARDTSRLIVTMVLPDKKDLLFKVIAKQHIRGIDIIDLNLRPMDENNVSLTMEIDNSVSPDQISAFLNELEAMGDSFTVPECPSEVAP